MKNLKSKTAISVAVLSLLLMCLNTVQAKKPKLEVESQKTEIRSQHGKCNTKKYKLVKKRTVSSSSIPLNHNRLYNETVEKVKLTNRKKARKGACVRRLYTKYVYKSDLPRNKNVKSVYSIVLYNSVKK